MKAVLISLQTGIVDFMDQQFDMVDRTQRSMQLLSKFEALHLPNLPLGEKYKFVMTLYNRDLETVAKMYKTYCSDPPIARNFPPIAGKIAWARQLYNRISEPMQQFQNHEHLLRYAGAKKIIRFYNIVSKVLVEYEIVHHRGWLRQVRILCCSCRMPNVYFCSFI